jgi:cytochrome c-type biogenesis protein CcmH
MRKMIPFLVILLVPVHLWAAGMSEDELQARIKEVSKSLRCAVCQSESVWESNAELALQMRRIIRERLLQGESPDQIRAYFQGRYGDFILLKPRIGGLNLLLWVGPFVLLSAGGFALYRTLRRWAAAESPPLPISTPLSEENQKRIEAELKSFQG